MRGLSVLTCAALVSLAAGSAAFAEDKLYTRYDATELTSDSVGQPYWALNAHCAGMFGAAYNYENQRGEAQAAGLAKSRGVTLLNASLQRLQSDRGISRQEAIAVASAEVERGRARAQVMLVNDTRASIDEWDIARSMCLDIGKMP